MARNIKKMFIFILFVCEENCFKYHFLLSLQCILLNEKVKISLKNKNKLYIKNILLNNIFFFCLKKCLKLKTLFLKRKTWDFCYKIYIKNDNNIFNCGKFKMNTSIFFNFFNLSFENMFLYFSKVFQISIYKYL